MFYSENLKKGVLLYYEINNGKCNNQTSVRINPGVNVFSVCRLPVVKLNRWQNSKETRRKRGGVLRVKLDYDKIYSMKRWME